MNSLKSIATLLVLTLTGCSTNSKLSNNFTHNNFSKDNCQVNFFIKPPTTPFKLLSKVETNVKENLFFGGSVTLEKEGYAELRKQACSIGGNAVIIEDVINSSAAEVNHIYIWASIISIEAN